MNTYSFYGSYSGFKIHCQSWQKTLHIACPCSTCSLLQLNLETQLRRTPLEPSIYPFLGYVSGAAMSIVKKNCKSVHTTTHFVMRYEMPRLTMLFETAVLSHIGSNLAVFLDPLKRSLDVVEQGELCAKSVFSHILSYVWEKMNSLSVIASFGHHTGDSSNLRTQHPPTYV
jgi:hypothetical protein